MMNPDEAQRAFRKWAPKWSPTLAEAFAAGHFDTSASGVCFSEGYRAGAAASDARIKALEEALAMADQLCRVALPQFNWAASALDGQAVFILNEAPGIIRRALLKEGDL